MSAIDVIRKPAVVLALTSAVSLAVGSGAGYLIAKKRVTEEFRLIVDREIMEARRFYMALNKRESFEKPSLVMVSPEEVAAADAMLEYQGQGPVVIDELPSGGGSNHIQKEGVSENVFEWFDKTKPNLMDIGEEIEARQTSHLYVISDEDFVQTDNQTVTLTWYEADNVLADERDIPLSEEIDQVIGENNMRFGDLSGDSRVVYVRNTNLGIDYEVLHHTGSYSEVVHGIPIEPSQKNRKRPRGGDE